MTENNPTAQAPASAPPADVGYVAESLTDRLDKWAASLDDLKVPQAIACSGATADALLKESNKMIVPLLKGARETLMGTPVEIFDGLSYGETRVIYSDDDRRQVRADSLMGLIGKAA